MPVASFVQLISIFIIWNVGISRASSSQIGAEIPVQTTTNNLHNSKIYLQTTFFVPILSSSEITRQSVSGVAKRYRPRLQEIEKRNI